MTFQTFLEPANLLKTILLAISIFNLVAFLWLACTVWLNGDHRARITLWGVVGLSFAALFSFLHALLISTPLVDEQAVELANLLWMLDWIPALGVPYIWFAIGLHYASLINV